MNLWDMFTAKMEALQWIYGIIAVCGGIARYLRSYTSGDVFDWRVFFASAFFSGFSGWMFAIIGLSLDLPQNLIFVLAGTGGFFGDQTMKLAYEYVKTKISS